MSLAFAIVCLVLIFDVPTRVLYVPRINKRNPASRYLPDYVEC